MTWASLDDTLARLQAGGMVILTDDEARENEGDLVVAAQYADASAINFMARYGRGLICLALDEPRVTQLDLPLMAARNRSRHGTAFTVSIEAREGITTGISAADRARTIAVAIDDQCTSDDLVSPGHIFPLVAARGGVLVRAGHTEAAVDLARAAQLNPSGVICEIMNDDGTMARHKDLMAFADTHRLPMARISDLIAWRLAHEEHIRCTHEEDFHARDGGQFRLKQFTDDIAQGTHVALIKGDIRSEADVWVRVQGFSGMTDVVELLRFEAKQYGMAALPMACRHIERHGAGIILLIDHDETVSQKQEGDGLRHYGIGAQILRHLGVSRMVLLTNHQTHIHGLEGFGLTITKRQPLNES